MDTNSVPPGRLSRWRTRRPGLRVIALVATATVIGGLYVQSPSGYGGQTHRPMPSSPEIENQTGIRLDRVHVVADGGLVDLRYIVLDPDRALRFQSDVGHPPVIDSARSGRHVERAALMKQGHVLRAGQTHFMLFYNKDGAIKKGDDTTITIGRVRLQHVPVD